MIKNDDLKTSPKQRLVIAAVAVFMLASTFALYAGIVLNYGSKNNASNNLTSEEQARYDELLAEYNANVEKQADELSAKYFDSFKSYKSQVKAFNAASVDNLKTEDLKIGTGRTISGTEDVDYSAYYIGWLSDETVFDSSFDNIENPTKLKSPLGGTTGLIEGWKKGIDGMKIGGVRILSIPSALGYGDTEQGNIPANSPLKFVIMLVDKVEDVEMNSELMNLYYKSMGVNLSDMGSSSEDAGTSDEAAEAENAEQ